MTTAAPAEVPIASPNARASLRLVGVLAGSWLVLLVIGFAMLRQPNALAAGNPVSGGRAAFVSASVGAMNGFMLDFARPADFSAGVRAVFVLQTVSSLLLTLIGGGVLWARVLGRPYSDAQVTRTAVGMIVIGVAVGMLTHRGEESMGTAAIRGLCVLGNGGVLFGDAPRPGLIFSLGLVPLSLVGSFGTVVVRDLVNAVFRSDRLSEHASRVVTLTAVVYLLGIGLLMAAEHVAGKAWRPELARFDGLVWMARGWGDPIEFASNFTDGVFAILLGIAVIGVGTAGTAGALGVGWLFTVPPRLRPTILNGLTAQAVIAAGTLALLAAFEPSLYPARRLLLTISAVMNLGLSHDALSITGTSLFALTAAMVAAKLAPLVLFAHALLRPPVEAAS